MGTSELPTSTPTPFSHSISVPTYTQEPPTTFQTSTLPPVTPVSTPAVKTEPSTTAPAPVPPAPVAGTPNVGSSSGSGASRVGEATYYTPGLGSCGKTSTDSEYIVAISALLMNSQKTANSNNNPMCGRMINVSYNGGKSISVKCVDTCPECAENALDLSPAAFEGIGAKKEAGRVPVTWSFAD
ncbi:RlpA-like double-psi beta-barrel-protein domain-containing protein-containing protein [Tuber brumale]|nr:RlpA-like double-psi beta-barrel-protein domain-containing protein-containing protein [Tuber brumale]